MGGQEYIFPVVELKKENLAPEDEVRVDTLGYVQNGVVTEAAKCVGCKGFFEELRWEIGEKDPVPVCGPCAKNMEP